MSLASSEPAGPTARRPRIAVLCTGSPLAAMFINGVRKRFPDAVVLREDAESKLTILRRRGRLVGWTQAIGQAVILQGHKVLYRETHILLEEVAEATVSGERKQYMESIAGAALLIIDDFGMRKLPQTAAEDLLEIVMRRYERASKLLTSNRPVEDWGKLLEDVAADGAMLDRLFHHGHVLKCGPKRWRTKDVAPGR